MSTAEFTIGRLARETGCKVTTIRYYEQIGLLPEAHRSSGNTRLFGSEHVARLTFIRHCRALGFSQVAVRELLELTDHSDWSCHTVINIAQGHLDGLIERITRLTALKCELERMVATCRGGRIAECRIIELLSDHSHAERVTAP